MPLRQLSAACLRSPSLSSTCTSFSASAKVTAETSGPTAGAAANVGGAPGGSGAAFGSCLHEVAASPSKLSEPSAKNCLRDLDMAPLLRILTCRRTTFLRRALLLYQGTTFCGAVKLSEILAKVSSE